MKKKVVIAGGSGAVGTACLKELAARDDVFVTVLVRTPGLLKRLAIESQNFCEVIFNFEDLDEYTHIGSQTLPCDAFFCCLGSTIKAAGSRRKFVRIEHDFPVYFLESLKKNSSHSTFAFVSSFGASESGGFYLANKRAVEKKIQMSGLRYVIARPSLILGNRSEFRLGESAAKVIMVPLFSGLDLLGLTQVKLLAALSPIEASTIAHKLIHASLDSSEKNGIIVEGREFYTTH